MGAAGSSPDKSRFSVCMAFEVCMCRWDRIGRFPFRIAGHGIALGNIGAFYSDPGESSIPFVNLAF